MTAFVTVPSREPGLAEGWTCASIAAANAYSSEKRLTLTAILP
ncbi:MAG TPA: hypothetical protein VKU19_25670 [Bryobacteraceae bacterium]|nr:hypothetical protein [Bryobacteraceae bacterium]